MSQVSIAPIVEGAGEEAALRCLVTRVALHLDPNLYVNMARPFRQSSGSLLRPGGIERAVVAVGVQRPDHHILILLDADDDCAKTLGPELQHRARAAQPNLSISVVLCVREFECWLMAGVNTLRGKRGLSATVEPPAHPESTRGAKEWLSDRMEGTRKYRPTVDQAAFTDLFDLEAALSRCRSFRKFRDEIRRILGAVHIS